MKIAVVDDYQDAVRGLDCFAKLAGHEVVVHHGATTDDELVAQLAGVEAVVLIRERTKITASLLARLPSLRVISQTGKAGPHIDRAACEAHEKDSYELYFGIAFDNVLAWAREHASPAP